MSKRELGNWGEEAACRYLEKHGYRIVARNYALPGLGEIDIVVRAPGGELVFAEVKALAGAEDPATGLIPEDNLTSAKLHKMKNAAKGFLARNPDLAGAAGWRLDVLAVQAGESGSKPVLRHYENVS